MLSWRTTSLEAERPGPRCGPAPRRGLRPAHPHCDCLVCQTSQLARTRCSQRPVLTLSFQTPATLAPDDVNFREPKPTVQI